jgi:ankyrin repeat protein
MACPRLRRVCAIIACFLCGALLVNSYVFVFMALSETRPLDVELVSLRALAAIPTVNCTATRDAMNFCWQRIECVNDFDGRIQNEFGVTTYRDLAGAYVVFRPNCKFFLIETPPKEEEHQLFFPRNYSENSDRFYVLFASDEVANAIAAVESERAAVIVKWTASFTLILCVLGACCIGLQVGRVRNKSNRLSRFIVCCGVCTPVCVVRRWLRKPLFDVNAVEHVHRTTVLHAAAKHGTAGVVGALVEVDGINLNCLSSNGMTPLHLAALRGRADIITRLLAASADPNMRDNRRLTPLGYAARENNSKCVRALLDGGASCDVDGELYGPLYLAVHNKQGASQRELLARGASLSKALLTAVRYSDTAVIRFMLRKGADVEAHDSTLSTPLFLAANIGSLKHVKLLMEHGAEHRATVDNRLPLHVAAACGHVDVVAYFLQQGVDVNSTDVSGCTAAHVVGVAPLVPSTKTIEVLKLLLAEPRIDVNRRNHAGETVLFDMTQRGLVAGVRMLIAAGADCAAVCAGTTALEAAAERGYTAILAMLATPADIVDDTELLRLAIAGAHCETIQWLLALGAVPDEAMMTVARQSLDALQVKNAVVLMMLRAAMSEPDPIGFTLANVPDDMDDAETLASDSDDVPMITLPIDEETACLAEARKTLSRMRAAMIRERMLEVLFGLVALRRLSALELMTIVDATNTLARYMPFHLKWKIICAVLENAKRTNV